ncbi:putative phosphotransferase [Fimbriimonas ginsengisoli Gsoil 348]|uniref:Putative phosphotransferase n=1 Tax=Fimbriimonas ginsengisoli Gsoil 348 TaxID=661478 RepID=A0A068NV48_FIMGI|nr:putative phosphotransferase [Fimbriimonas ginsengisoli Gsoil 348]
MVWMNLGVDVFVREVTPERFRPGIGLRPGGERPDLEPYLPPMFAALYDSIAAHSRQGLNVVVDVGHHDSYSRPLGMLSRCAERVRGLPVLFVGVRCPIEVIMQRRNDGQDGREYLRGSEVDPPLPVRCWQEAVHVPGIYDLEVDTSVASPEECAERILKRIQEGLSPDAFWRAGEALSSKNLPDNEDARPCRTECGRGLRMN